MRKSRPVLFLLVVISVVLFSGVSAGADRSEGVRGIFGLKYGMLGGGYIKVENVSDKFEKESGQSLGILLDYPIKRRLHFGIFADLHSIVITFKPLHVNVNKDSETLLEVGAMLKYLIPTGQGKFSLRPGVGGGYGILRNMPYIGNSNYWTFRSTMEFIVKIGRTTDIAAELGIWSAPSGGNDELDITSKAKLLLRFGLLFR